MGINVSVPFEEISNYIDEQLQRWLTVVVRRLNRIGLQAVTRVRARSGEDSWFDQTGNLRSSIGYCICENGKVTNSSGFKKVKQGNEGVIEGQKYLEQIAAKYPTDYVLIIVAGMEYAVYVEAMENKDVLASAEIFVKDEIAKLCK